MRIQVDLTGTTPLIMHNVQLADPTNKYVIAIKERTSKGKRQTETDKKEISLFEWQGGLYLDEKYEVVIPAACLLKCFSEAGKVTRKGTDVIRGLTVLGGVTTPLMTDGPRHVDELIKDPKYVDRRAVGVQKSKVMRTRPIFNKWGLSARFEFLDDVLNYSTITNIIELAGRAIGLCDARILGYGRFEATISKAK